MSSKEEAKIRKFDLKVVWKDGVSRITFNLFIRSLHLFVPVWAVGSVDVVQNDFRRHIPDLLLAQKLSQLTIARRRNTPSDSTPVKLCLSVKPVEKREQVVISTACITQPPNALLIEDVVLFSFYPWRHTLGEASGATNTEALLQRPDEKPSGRHHPKSKTNCILATLNVSRSRAIDDGYHSRRYPVYNVSVLEDEPQTRRVKSALVRGRGNVHEHDITVIARYNLKKHLDELKEALERNAHALARRAPERMHCDQGPNVASTYMVDTLS